jgi:Cysteine-rich secretory protein family
MKLLPVGLALALLIVSVGAVSAATVSSTERQIMTSINEARASNGLAPLRSVSRLWLLADQRAAAMAASGILSHSTGGSIDEGLRRGGIQWYGYGEVIAYTSTAGSAAARHLFQLWATSPPHWALLTSSTFNYLGIGLAVSGSGRTYGSIVLTESKDRTGARGTMTGATVTGDDVHWTWRGVDPKLQTHTAGLRDFAVQQRTDRGGWVTVSTGTQSTARTAVNRAHGHWYGLRVRARDRVGNVGPWSSELRVWVP